MKKIFSYGMFILFTIFVFGLGAFASSHFNTMITSNQDFLSDSGDMYLYAMWSGFNWSSNPRYKIANVDTNIIHLEDLYYDKGHDIQFPGAENFIKVTYSIDNESQSFIQISYPTEGIKGRNLADIIYIDPNDSNTIYLEFCGLWKMERDNNQYGTGGKSSY
ncbi:hypothetical protein LJC58_07915 [Lachnospiraceae bacterium OttesenSCG-928-D06]|nr:hypothetical protein [Lachnospiraceae bacterium OttesenSCG-928-D06]